MNPQKTALIVGSGLGGLATALILARKGLKVVILEKHHQAGGRLNQFSSEGFVFDTGPSFFSMSYEFDDYFQELGLDNPLKFNALDPLYAVYFSHHDRPFYIHKDTAKLEKEFAHLEPNLKEKLDRYLEKAGHVFHDTEYRIVKRNYDSILDYLRALVTVPLRNLPLLFRSMWTELERNFQSEEAKVIFSLVAFFLGSTPFQTPAVYSLLNYSEMVHDGYWNVQGGMYRIVQEMKKFLDKEDVTFHFSTEVVGIEEKGSEITGMIDSSGKIWKADVYVANSDAASFRGRILKKKKWSDKKLDKMDWTLAPFTIYLGVKGKLDNLHHHNYFLRDNFREYANDIFTASEIPDKPYYYVNVSSRSNPNCAPEGCENIFILAPVPDLRYKKEWTDREEIADSIISDLSKRVGYDLGENTLTRTIYSPDKWESMFNLYRGSGLGLAHGLNQVGALRPSNKDEDYSNLYYVGASTVPGTGLPIVMISSRLVTQKIFKDHGFI